VDDLTPVLKDVWRVRESYDSNNYNLMCLPIVNTCVQLTELVFTIYIHSAIIVIIAVLIIGSQLYYNMCI